MGGEGKPAPSKLSSIATNFLGIMKGLYDAFEDGTDAMHGQDLNPRLSWGELPQVDYAAGGYVLDDVVLDRVNNPRGIELVFDPPAGTRLEVGQHTLSVRAADGNTYTTAPVTTRLTVRKARATIQWPPLDAVDWTEGGYVLLQTQLAAVTVPPGLGVTYSHAAGAKLGVGDVAIVASLAPHASYKADAVTNTLTVKPVAATIEWEEPAGVTWVPGGYLLGSGQLNAKTVPAGAAIVYSPAAGTALQPGEHAITASLAPGNHVAKPVTRTLAIAKATATISWAGQKLTAPLDGYRFDSKQLKASTQPPGLKLKWSVADGTSLAGGAHPITASIDPGEPYVAEAVKADLVIEKPLVEIVWDTPAAVDWVAGGHVPGPAQLNARTQPPTDAKISYQWAAQGPLGPSSEGHVLTASIAETEAVQARPVTRKLVVNKARPGINWPAAKFADVAFARGGYPLGDKQLSMLLNPNGIEVDFDPPPGTRLQVDTYDIKARARDTLHYDATPVMAKLKVNKGSAKITWAPPAPVNWVSGGFELTEAQLNATVEPDGIELHYEPEEGEKLEAGAGKKLKVSLAEIERTDWDCQPVTVLINVVQTKEQKSRESIRATVEENRRKEQSKAPALSKEEQQRLAEARRVNRERAEALDKLDVEPGLLTNEYPYGGPNEIPHIHSYAKGFHLKILSGGKVKRMNLVKNGLVYKSSADTLNIAWDYDQENGTNLRKVLKALLKPYE